MVFDKVSTSLDLVGRERDVLEFWAENDVFKKTLENRKGAPLFMFFDGPPTANGKPHIGHVLTRAIKDIFPRYKTMKGYLVPRKAGWDTHGLPVELEVEKQLGLDGKPQIEAYGIEPFIKECKKSVFTYKTEWERMTERVGFWLDMDDPYITYDNNYIESVWWSLSELHKKGLLYKGYRVMPYCPRCGTALSSHEVAQGYKDIEEASIYVKFKVKNEENTFLLAWTTTPWTLPSNLALIVNANLDYIRAEKDGEQLILAKGMADSVLGEGEYTVQATFKGSELFGMEYEPLFPFAKAALDAEGNTKKAWYVVNDPYVTLGEGTGIVHGAPAFGEDDARVGKLFDMPFVQPVDASGLFTEAATPYAGMFIKDADPVIIKDLKESGNLLKTHAHTHSYPFCWRCDTPLIYYARSSWFIKITAIRDKLMEVNRAVNWLPDHIKEGRMGNFIENIIDWNLSRERYWGTPLPVWECRGSDAASGTGVAGGTDTANGVGTAQEDGCSKLVVIGSIEELCRLGRKKDGSPMPPDIELHKPYIDEIVLTCPDCGKTMYRVPEVIDCWYDSGSMQFAQLHYPFENKDVFEKQHPAEFISEAIDQTRGWFYSLLAIGAILFEKPAFNNCLVMGHVLDKDSKKMSKHLGNIVDPFDVLDTQGADAVRWYFYSCGAPWISSRYYGDYVAESQRRFMGPLLNTYAFFVLYANIDDFNPADYKLDTASLSQMDRWILSRLSSLVADVDAHLEAYHVTEAARCLIGFVEELSNWYVRRCRERFWAKGMEADKINAYMTLYTVLVTLSGLTAPFVPFMAEQMYQNLVRKTGSPAPVSVHMTDFPKSNPDWIDKQLEKDMDALLTVVTLGRACRSSANMKVRQPLAAIYVKGIELTDEFARLAMDELNVKSLKTVDDARAFTTYRIKPQLKTLGPRYGKLVPEIGEYLKNSDGSDIVDIFNAGKQLTFKLGDTEVELSEADVLIDPMRREGFVAESDRDTTVVIDTHLTKELIDEGLVREVVSKVQNMRKEKDSEFEVTDRIHITIEAGGELANVIEAAKEAIMADTLAITIALSAPAAGAIAKEWDINGHAATIGISRA